MRVPVERIVPGGVRMGWIYEYVRKQELEHEFELDRDIRFNSGKNLGFDYWGWMEKKNGNLRHQVASVRCRCSCERIE